MKRETIQIDTDSKKVKCILLRPKKQDHPLPGIVWIHGGGYALGMAGMVHMSCGKMLAKRYGAVVISPEYAGEAGTVPCRSGRLLCRAAIRVGSCPDA